MTLTNNSGSMPRLIEKDSAAIRQRCVYRTAPADPAWTQKVGRLKWVSSETAFLHRQDAAATICVVLTPAAEADLLWSTRPWLRRHVFAGELDRIYSLMPRPVCIPGSWPADRATSRVN